MNDRLERQDKKVLSFIQKKNLLKSGDNCLIALSGGADSISLFYILIKIAKILKISKISIAHVNYNLREQDSIDEEIYVKSIAEKYNLDFYCKSIKLLEIKEKNKSLEDFAREIRYNFFEEICNKYNYNKILVAHNSNDHAETIIMKLIKGTVLGLKGIDSIRDFSTTNNKLKIVRPVLCLSRKEIEEYCNKNKIEYKIDKSNFSNDYTRNRIRNNLLPLFIEENTNFLETIRNSSDIFSEEQTFILDLSIEYYKKSLLKIETNMIILSEKIIKNLNHVLIKKIVKYSFEELTKSKKSIASNRFEEIISSISKNISGKIIEIGDNLYFTKDKEYLLFTRNLPNFEPIFFEYKIQINQKINIKELDIDFILDDEKIRKKITNINNIKISNYDNKKEFYIEEKKGIYNLKDFFDKKQIPNILRKNMILLYENNTLIHYFL
ncbi:MAG: tRNA lysidine(34) synthetase TilS [Cyanobacteriota bacterium]